MHQSWNNLELVTLEDETPCGISLGFDYCGEHERGHDSMGRSLSLGHASKTGLTQFLAKPISPDDLRLSIYDRSKSTKTIAAETRLTFHVVPDIAQELAIPKAKRRDLPAAYIREGQCDTPLAASWDSNGFCIRAFGEAERDMVRKLHAAALAGDLLVSNAKNANPFGRGGLCLTMLSMIPQSVHDTFAADEAEQKRLDEAALKTGIKDDLRNAGLEWFALKAKWSDFFKTIIRDVEGSASRSIPRPPTEHDVMFFLNPRDQRRHNHGWFTVEELQAWIRGEGPVIKDL